MNSSSKVLVSLSSSSSTKRLFFLFQRGFSGPIASPLPEENNESDSATAMAESTHLADPAPEKAESAPGKAESATLEADLTAGNSWRESSASFANKALAGATTVGSVIDLATKAGNIVGVGKATAEVGPVEAWKKVQEKFNLFDDDKEKLKFAIRNISERLDVIESKLKLITGMTREVLSKSSGFKSGGAVGVKSGKEDEKSPEEAANEKGGFFGKFGKFWYGSANGKGNGKGNGHGNGNGNGNGNGCEGGD